MAVAAVGPRQGWWVRFVRLGGNSVGSPGGRDGPCNADHEMYSLSQEPLCLHLRVQHILELCHVRMFPSLDCMLHVGMS